MEPIENPEKEIISWEEFGAMAEKLAEQIYASGIKYTGIYGLPRGGLPLAVTLSHQLGIPYAHHLPLDFGVEDGRNILVVDDIVDTGAQTLKLKNDIATLYLKPWSKVQPKYFVNMTVNWIVYPWEKV